MSYTTFIFITLTAKIIQWLKSGLKLSFSEIQNLNCQKLVTKIDDQTKMIEHDFRKFYEKNPSHLELV